MKIRYLSDLHLEMLDLNAISKTGNAKAFALAQKWWAFNPNAGEDVLVLAGDIYNDPTGMWLKPRLVSYETLAAWACATFTTKHIIYVPGNHEYYRPGAGLGDVKKLVRSKLTKEQRARFHVLDQNGVVIDGVAFYGATFWTDLMLNGTICEAQALTSGRNMMNDYRHTWVKDEYGNTRKAQPSDMVKEHTLARNGLVDFHRKHLREKLVVVSHHAPSAQSISPRFAGDTLGNVFYASNLEGFMQDRNVTLWIHGHMHDGVDYQVRHHPMMGRAPGVTHTRVVSNPRGYPQVGHDNVIRTENPYFDENKLVEI